MDMVVLAHIKEQSRLSLGSYGRPRMTEELKEVGVDVGHRRIGRLMRENGIVIDGTRRFKATTGSVLNFVYLARSMPFGTLKRRSVR